MRKTILLLLLTAVLPASATDFAFRHYTSRDGLAANNIRAILQDRMGLVWLGTANGLDSFDGREILHHPLPGGAGGTVLCLLEDTSGALWIGTDIAVYRYAEGGIVRLEGLPEANVTALTEDRAGGIWISFWSEGVFRYREGTLTHFLPRHEVEDLLVARDGRLWIADASSGEGVLLFDPKSETFVSPGLAFEGSSPTRVCALAEDPDGNLWMGTWTHGIYRMETETGTVRTAVPYGQGLHHIHSLLLEEDGTLLIGSDDGLLLADPSTGKQALYRNDRKDPASLSDKFVYPLLRDHEGGLWVGTYYGGLNYVAPNVGQFRSLSLSDLTGADEGYIVSCFCEDPDGTLWIGSDNGGLFRYDPARNLVSRWEAPSPWKERLTALNVHALVRQGDDLWIGTYSENLLRLHLKTGRIRVYGPEQGLDAATAYALGRDADGTLWAGTNTGICRYDADSDRFTLERTTGDWIVDLRADADGALWFATSRSGLLRRSPDGSWRSFTVSDGLPSNYVNALLSSPQGLFVGTQTGLVRLEGDHAKTLLDNVDVLSVIPDGPEALWLSTSAGIVRLSLPDRTEERFGAHDGVYASLFSPKAGILTRDGTVYLGAADGVVAFRPENIRGNAIAPPVLFTRFLASGAGLTEDVFQTRGRSGIVLPWRLKDVQISFAALSYCAPENNQYAYRLEGLDPDWKELGSGNTLTLSQLRPGRYRLKVIASNNSGVWNRDGATLSFTLRPHPLLSGVAFTLYIFLFVALVLLWIWLLMQRTWRKSKVLYEQKLDAAVSVVKEEERDERFQFLSTLTDQIEQPLTGIGLQLDRLKEQPRTSPAVKGGLTVIEKNFRSLRSIATNLQQMRQALAPETDAAQPETDESEDFLLKLDRLIAENLANPDLSVAFLAREMAVSRSGLFAKIKELSGETPNKRINQARLNAAAKLLAEGHHPIGEICYMTGFSSPSYFSKSFLAQFGITPHEWVQLHKASQLPPDDATDRSEPS